MTIHRLEDLPNEIFLEIFDYLDLFHGFIGLNQRLNDLLRILPNLSLYLQQIQPKLIELFAHRITRLMVDTWQQIDFQQFPSLKSLIFHQMSLNHFRQIRWELMPNLLYLSTVNVPQLTLMNPLAKQIFSNALPSVRSINFGLVQTPLYNSWSQSPSLSSISIHSRDPTLILFILHSCPNLISLHVYFQMDTIAIFHSAPKITHHPLREFHLFDPYHRLLFNHIHTILVSIPYLRKIYLNCSFKIPFIRFARSLINRLPDLQSFHCLIDDTSSDKSTPIEIIQQLHRCFRTIHHSTIEFHFRTFQTDYQRHLSNH